MAVMNTMIPKLALLVMCGLLAISSNLSGVESAISCNQVVNDLYPCINYVLGGGIVPNECCLGVQAVYAAAGTTYDRQSVCSCLKSVVNGVPVSSAAAANAASLPAKCGVKIPYKISPSTDCRSVKY